MTILTLRCLGALEAQLDAVAVTGFATDKIRALLVYLALEPSRPHRREELMGLFWPEIAQSAAQNNLRVTLHRLRDALNKVQPNVAERTLLSTRQTLQIDPTQVTVDALTFQTLLATCASHAHETLSHCPDCRARLREAVDLYRGELLAGFGLVDAPPFEEWLLLRREMLHQQALAALHTLVQSYEQLGDDTQAHVYASRQLALDPSREEAHRQLMRSLARRGLRREALAQYEQCRRILREQLGVEPDVETVALYEQIRVGEVRSTIADLRAAGVPAVRSVLDTSGTEQRATLDQSLVNQKSKIVDRTDWSEAPTVTSLYGREAELTQLERWLVPMRCRLIGLLGIGGVGKTTLAAATVETVAPYFDRVLWRSLLNAPPLDELLRDILQRLADERLVDIPPRLDAQLALLLDHLRQRRCLLVLDNLESILQPDQPGQMRAGYEGYAQLLQTVAERSHQSCLLLTSRERPQGVERWEEDSPLVRTLPLEGIPVTAGQAMLTARGLSGPAADAANLVARYSGNPLALKLVAQTVQEIFGGDIGAFLAVDAPIFEDIRMVLDQQFARLSPLEQELLLWLAVERVPVTAAALRTNLVQLPPMPRFLEGLRTLQRRSLLETIGAGFTVQNVVIEYLTEQLVEAVSQEILDLKSKIVNRYALLKAQATESIRQSQARLLLRPVAERLLAQVGKTHLATRIEWLLTTLRHTAPLTPGYTGGNLLNLLLALGLDVSGYDFSHLCVWQAYLRDAYLPGLQLVGADLRGAAFAQRIGAVQGIYFGDDQELRVIACKDDLLGLWRARTGELIQRIRMDARTFQTAFVRSDGRLLAQLTTQRTIHLVDVPTNRLLHTLVGDPSPIWRISFSPNGHYVASGHASGQICLWEVASGRLCNQWQAHRASSVTALAFSPDNVWLASGAVDGSLALWQAATATLLHTLPGHTDEVATLGFSPDGTTLITGSHDLTVRLWETASGARQGLLQGHTHLVRQLAIAPNGRWLATGGVDNFVYLWDLQTKKVLHMLSDHAAPVEQIAFSPDNQTVAAYDANKTISVWAVASGQRLDSYRLHHASIFTLAFSSDGHRLVSAGADSTVYLWDVSQPTHAQVTTRLVGHRYGVGAVGFSPDDALIASADGAGGLRLWYSPNHPTGSWSSRELLGAQTSINQIAFSPDGQLLAGTSDDGLRLWSLATDRQTHLLQGATLSARMCAFSPDGRWLASGHLGHTICLWSLAEPTGIVLRHTLDQHTNLICALLFSPDSRTLFSSSYDDTLRRWEVASGTLQASWSTHGTVYTALAIQPDGQRIASGSSDHAIRFLDSESGDIGSIWHGHTHTVEALTFSADGQLLASASQDETIRLWDVTTGACLQTLRTPGPYAGMNITGVTGISAAQKAALKTLGAVEEEGEIGRQGDRETGALVSSEQSSAPLLPYSPTPLHNLPAQLTPFVGRTPELAAVIQQLHDPNIRLLTITGAGGMGKTRLAVEVAKKMNEVLVEDGAESRQLSTANRQFRDGLFFVPLAPINRASELAVAIASAVGLNLTGGDPQQMVFRFLVPKRLLLILDNFEHLLVTIASAQDASPQHITDTSGAQLVVELLQAAPDVKILVTSREKLKLQGEHIYPISGMDFAQTSTLSAAENATAVRLFVQCARRVQPDFALNERHLPALLRICRLVEGMPLGLELAAAWVEILSLEEIAQEIEKSLDFLAVDWPEIPARQRSMRAVFEWSWRLLGDPERQVLRRLAVFRGGFTRPAAEQITGATLRVLTGLVQKSLLRRSTSAGETGTGRYELHELLRQFAAEQLAAQPDEQRAAAARHSSFYLAFAAARERRLARNEPKEAASEIYAEIDNVRQAWLWAVHQGAWSDLNVGAYALRLFYTFTSMESEGEQFFQLAIEHLRTVPAPSLAESQRVLSKLLGYQAILLIAQMKHAEALALAQEAVALSAVASAENRSREGETFGHLAWGMVLALESPSPAARARLEHALESAQRYQALAAVGQAPIEALYDAEWVARLSLRDLDRYADNYASAVAHVQHAVQLCRSLGKLRGEMNCLIHLADPLMKLHDYAAAQQACEQGLQLARTLNNRWGEGFSLHHLGNATRLLGRYGEAHTLLMRAYTLMQADSDLSQEAMSAALLGHLLNLMGDTVQARTWFDRFLRLLQQFPEPWPEAELEGLLPLALFCHDSGDDRQTLRYATQSWQLAEKYGWRESQAKALIVCGYAQVGLQQLAAAAASYAQALALCQTLNHAPLAAEAQAALARLALEQADLAQAQRHVEDILLVLQRYPQAGMDEPFAIYLTCYRVLAAANDQRSATILQRGYDLLQQYASHILDDTLRHSFLENIPVHRTLRETYQQRSVVPMVV